MHSDINAIIIGFRGLCDRIKFENGLVFGPAKRTSKPKLGPQRAPRVVPPPGDLPKLTPQVFDALFIGKSNGNALKQERDSSRARRR